MSNHTRIVVVTNALVYPAITQFDSYKDIQLMRNSSCSVQPDATICTACLVSNGEDQNNALLVTLSLVLVCNPHSADC